MATTQELVARYRDLRNATDLDATEADRIDIVEAVWSDRSVEVLAFLGAVVEDNGETVFVRIESLKKLIRCGQLSPEGREQAIRSLMRALRESSAILLAFHAAQECSSL